MYVILDGEASISVQMRVRKGTLITHIYKGDVSETS